MQTFDPKKRLTVDQALEHPYLSAYVRPILHHPFVAESSLTMPPVLFLRTGFRLRNIIHLPDSISPSCSSRPSSVALETRPNLESLDPGDAPRPQHDPEDEPAVSSLDPEYFEFDCKSHPPSTPPPIFP